MVLRIVYHPLAANDFEDAVNWYVNQSVGATKRFVDEVNRAISLISTNPDRGANKHAHCRELKLSKFPFTVVYTFDEGQAFLVITAIHHHKKDHESKYR